MSSIAITGLLHHKTVLSLKSRENIINAKLLRGLLNIRNKINLNTLIKSIYKVFYPTLNVLYLSYIECGIKNRIPARKEHCDIHRP